MNNFEKVAELCKERGFNFSVGERFGDAVFRLSKPNEKPIDVVVQKTPYMTDMELDVRAYREINRILTVDEDMYE